MATRIAFFASLCVLLGSLSSAEAKDPAHRSVSRPAAAHAGAKRVSTTIFAPHQYVRRVGMIRTPQGSYFDLYSDGRMGIPGRGGAASGSGPIYAPQPRQVSRPADAQAGKKKASGDWTRSSSQTVTIDTRGINAGTREGQAALRAADSLARDSRILGSSASPSQAQSFNQRAQSVASQVNSVAASHRAQAAERARSDAFIRNLVSSRSRR